MQASEVFTCTKTVPSVYAWGLIARVVRCPHMLHVNATSILRRGDFVNRDHGNVETCSVLDLVLTSAGTEGPSNPEPVVHPLPAAAFSTNPIAAS